MHLSCLGSVVLGQHLVGSVVIRGEHLVESVLMGEHLVGSVVIRREHLVGSVLIRGVPSEVSAAACAFHIRLPHPELLNTHHGKWEWLMAAVKQACSSWTQKFTFGGLESLMAVTSLFINMAGNTPLHTIHTHVIISQVL